MSPMPEFERGSLDETSDVPPEVGCADNDEVGWLNLRRLRRLVWWVLEAAVEDGILR